MAFEEYEGADWLPEGSEREPNYNKPQYEDVDVACDCTSPEECENNCWTYNPADYEYGEFEVGQRVALTAAASETKHVGATGTIVRIDADEEDLILPVVVWLDIFGEPSAVEKAQGMGLPVCAREITLIKERTIS